MALPQTFFIHVHTPPKKQTSIVPRQLTGALSLPANPVASTLVVLTVIATGGLTGALLLAKHKVLGAILGGVAGLVGVGLLQKAHAAGPVPVPTTCPNGSAAPGGNTANCPQLGQSLGSNDPDSPPGGWTYNAPVAAPSAVQAAAQALAAVDPCDPANEQLVRNFQAAAGLAQLNGGPGWDSVNPPGTDGRYGGDAAKALAQYVSNAPAACYSNANPTRPSWWGAVGTYTNPGAAAAAASPTPASS